MRSVKGMTVSELILELKKQLIPAGSSPSVRLSMGKKSYFKREVIESAISKLETSLLNQQKVNELEKIGIDVLLHSAKFDKEW